MGAWDRQPLRETEWLVTSGHRDDGAGARRHRTDDEGLLTLEPGPWIIESTSSSLSCNDGRVDLLGGETHTIWVQRRKDLEFLLLDPRGRPLPDADGYWFPGDPWPGNRLPVSGSEPSKSLMEEARADAQGLVVFHEVPADMGTAVFLATGYAREVRRITAGLSDVLQVTLWPDAAPGRRLTFIYADGEERVPQVSVLSSAGYVVARATSVDGEVVVPGWLDPNEPLKAVSPSTFPSGFRADALGESPVALYRLAQCQVLVRSPPPTTDRALVSITVDPLALVGAQAVPAMAPPRYIAVGAPVLWELPRGLPLVASALDRIGREDEKRLTLSGATEGIEIELKAADDPLQVEVVDDRGRLLRDAWASVDYRGGGRARISSPEEGRLSVPRPAGVTSMEVGAPGYGTRAFRRQSQRQESLVRRLSVVLSHKRDVTIRVATTAGEPQPGLAIRVWPNAGGPSLRDPALDATEEWIANNPMAVIGVTNGRGEFAVRGLAHACMDVVLGLHEAFGTDAWGRTTYSIRERLCLEEHESERVLTVDAPRSIALRVLESTTGAPVGRFTVDAGEGSPKQEVVGSFFQGWIRAGSRTLRIIVQGIGSAEIETGELPSGQVVDVFVEPTTTTEVRLAGLPPGATEGLATFTVFQLREGRSELLTTVTATLKDGRCGLYLPFAGTLRLAVQQVSGLPPGATFEPEFLPWEAGGALEFRVRP